ncbi:MBL fold metallo-hydrolase [Deinococcus reticulitermitis]|uniref:MBL fold metallo-hydrolase n=1 Tax=Deinococcus reticulitermitis TaxID=856736 RepID=UPI00248203EF|nr:MBL fold metallo-hydrolase [Deinococcus reticulitermitis]
MAQQFVTEPPKEERFASVRPTPPTVTFSDRLTLHGGDLTFELRPAPGHSADQVVVWIPELRTLLAADALEFPFPYPQSAETLPTLLDTFRALQALEPEIVLPCHGGTTSPELINQNLGYFARLREVVEAGTLPADWDTAPDLPDQLGYPFGQALAELGRPDLSNPDFYRDLHLTNVRATVKASRIQNRSSTPSPAPRPAPELPRT